MNAGLSNAKGERRIKVHSRCRRLCNDFRLMGYKEGTSTPEDYTGTDIGHMSDGFGYMMTRVMPMKVKQTSSPTVLIKESK